jgi:flagellar export protein FliJ
METKKLKRMLELKKRIEQAKKGEVVSAKHDLDEAQASLVAAQREQDERLRALAADEVSMHELVDRARFVVLAGKQVGVAREVVAERDREVALREEARMLATRDVKTFELLNERDRDESRVVARRAEQSAADDISSSRWSSQK